MSYWRDRKSSHGAVMAKANVLQPYQFQGKGLESLLGREQESEALTKLVAIAQISLPPQTAPTIL
jgi:hypothetical protein